MSDLELFPRGGGEGGAEGSGPSGSADPPSRGSPEAHGPLAARMRPATLEEYEGQEHLLGPGKPLRAMLERGELTSMIFWGPPGSGKTTLARLLAEASDAAFRPFSAVTEGIPRVREIIAEAAQRRAATGRGTILFCDEIHRFNKAQQDAFLPHVEEGVVVLIGATTENPSFEIVRPLLSRAPVMLLEPLGRNSLIRIMERALADGERGLGALELDADEGVLEGIARAADGDARRALGVLEAAAAILHDEGEGKEKGGQSGELRSGSRIITREVAETAIQHRFAVYDKGGEEHYNVISALHKSIRGSDPDAALYWLARMIEGGDDPLYIARRLVRMASEDVGMADPAALSVAVASRDAYHFLGTPEGELALAEAVVYLATAPKSNRIYEAWGEARRAAKDTASAPVPLHLRNAPTDLMKDLGYGTGYRYDPVEAHGVSPQRLLPESLGDARFYEPGPYGFEKTVAERLEWWERRREEARRSERESDRETEGDVAEVDAGGEAGGEAGRATGRAAAGADEAPAESAPNPEGEGG